MKVERMENQRPEEDMDRRISNNLQWQHNNDIVLGKEWERAGCGNRFNAHGQLQYAFPENRCAEAVGLTKTNP